MFFVGRHSDVLKLLGSSSDLKKAESPDNTATPEIQQITTRTDRTQSANETERHVFAWSNVCLDISTRDGKRRFIDKASGWVQSGQLKCLMSVSGAGGTTLLNLLAGRTALGTVPGDLFLNGKALPKSSSRFMGYVQQDDIHLSTQMIREALQIVAKLHGPKLLTRSDKYDYVESVIE